MIRFLIRLLGFLVLAAGFVALVVDGARAIASGVVTLTSLEASWATLAPESLAGAKAAAGGSAAASIAEPVVTFLLSAPTFAVLVALGVALMLLGRRPRRLVGVTP
ncbi:hypothetical protein JOD31_001517 [Methylopila capsulata]|uniref:PetM family of cytochrome b6f complex subunit 7 n=1 Tax=Methylopila capsulata TaxID=61654 RepID=A0A9W6IS69_9HYPH|nr:hypothetical protein [Methylopila capsulata]MBM7851292.1 hypothetical protein [Methylopila capsulata]GLK54350.1 hypothetical protein GCM10008170_03690 [Methylopila capsulata]